MKNKAKSFRAFDVDDVTVTPAGFILRYGPEVWTPTQRAATPDALEDAYSSGLGAWGPSPAPVAPVAKRPTARRPRHVFPHREVDERNFRDGQQVARARYWREVKDAAVALLSEVREEAAESGHNTDDLISDATSVAADSAVIYHVDVLSIVACTDHLDELDDATNEVGRSNVRDCLSHIAWHAYRADLSSAVAEIRGGGK